MLSSSIGFFVTMHGEKSCCEKKSPARDVNSFFGVDCGLRHDSGAKLWWVEEL